MAKKQVQWDLLPEERAQLRERTHAKIGNIKLIEALQRTLGLQAEAEGAWWEALRVRLGLSGKDAGSLIADHELGKVWIKGKVKKLDNKPPLATDNPCQ